MTKITWKLLEKNRIEIKAQFVTTEFLFSFKQLKSFYLIFIYFLNFFQVL